MSTTTVLSPLGEATFLHRPSHRSLLRRARPTGSAGIDAVVVPAARPAAELEPAAGLAAQLGSELVVLCSHEAKASEVNRLWGNAVHAVHVHDDRFLPRLLTSALLQSTPFARDNDTSAKRNAGLAVAAMTGWRRVLMLDDDITGVPAPLLGRAASLLEKFEVVGLENDGYPDNSVVCHAQRAVGGRQDTFIGAGAMLVRGSRTRSFFPDIYNEDWLFLLDECGLTTCAVHGTFAQKVFDPFEDPARAGAQELGDCLAEGLFGLLHAGRGVRDADAEFWSGFLAERGMLIESIRHRLRSTDLPRAERDRINESLLAARSHLWQITPQLCADYLTAWRNDTTRWRDWIAGLPAGLTTGEALSHLGFEI